jgi:hypothetical protein
MTPEFKAQYLTSYGRYGTKPDYTRCAESVAGSGRFPSYSQCTRKCGHGPHGAWCKQHDPEAVKAKREAQTAKWVAEIEASRRSRQFDADCKDAIHQIAAGHNDPRGLAQSIIDKLEGTK